MIKLFFLVTIFLTLFYFKSNSQNINVKVAVDAIDTNIKNRILSKIQTELRSKSRVIISPDDPTFIISIITAQIKSGDRVVGLSISTVLTKKVTTNENKITFEILTNIVNSINLNEIDAKCVELIARFDVDYFEKER